MRNFSRKLILLFAKYKQHVNFFRKYGTSWRICIARHLLDSVVRLWSDDKLMCHRRSHHHKVGHTHTLTAASLKWRCHTIVTSYSRRVHFVLLSTWLPCTRLCQVDTARCSVILPMVDSAFCCCACLYFDLNEWIQVRSLKYSSCIPEPLNCRWRSEPWYLICQIYLYLVCCIVLLRMI